MKLAWECDLCGLALKSYFWKHKTGLRTTNICRRCMDELRGGCSMGNKCPSAAHSHYFEGE